VWFIKKIGVVYHEKVHGFFNGWKLLVLYINLAMWCKSGVVVTQTSNAWTHPINVWKNHGAFFTSNVGFVFNYKHHLWPLNVVWWFWYIYAYYELHKWLLGKVHHIMINSFEVKNTTKITLAKIYVGWIPTNKEIHSLHQGLKVKLDNS
jgi:hypothetical protein